MTTAIIQVNDFDYIIAAEGSAAFATGILQALLAADRAEDAAEAAEIAAAAVGVYQTIAEGEAATVDGQSFYVAEGGTVTLYINQGGTGVAVATLPSDSSVTAIQSEVDALAIDLTDTQTNLATLGTVTGLAGNAPNVTQFPGHNFLNSGSGASAVMAGTVDQPNVVGGMGHFQTFVGDGIQSAFVVSPGFTVDDVAYRNILVYLVDRQSRGQTLQSSPGHYTVSGLGTSTVTINMIVTPTANQDIQVRVYRKQNSAFSPLLNFAGFGYDDFNDGSGSMVIQFGAHHININNPGGHNTFAGGAGSIARDSAAYAFMAGLSHNVSAGNAAFAAGMRGLLFGTAPFHAGASGKVGSWSAHFGELGEAETSFSVHFGRKGKTRIAGDRVISAGASTDPAAGMLTIHEYPLRRHLTSISSTSLIPVTGSATFAIPINSTAHVWGDFTLRDVASEDFRVLRLRATVQRDAGNIVSVVGLHSASADQFEILDEPPAFAPPSGAWQIQLFGGSSGGCAVFARGETGKNIHALGLVRVMVVDPTAAAI